MHFYIIQREVVKMQNLILAAQKSLGDTILVTTITGMLIVFAALILLIFIIWVFGKFFSGVSKNDKKAEKVAPVKSAPAAAPVVLPAATQSNDDIIAVIAAAVAVYGESEGKKYAVRSVRRSANTGGRSAWAAAGIAENVRSF